MQIFSFLDSDGLIFQVVKSVDWLARSCWASAILWHHCCTIALWHGLIGQFALWQGPLGLLTLLHHCTDLLGRSHNGTIALWQGPFGLLDLWHYGTSTTTVQRDGPKKIWYGLVGLLALWQAPLQGLVGQFALWHYGEGLLGRSHTVADWVPAPHQLCKHSTRELCRTLCQNSPNGVRS